MKIDKKIDDLDINRFKKDNLYQYETYRLALLKENFVVNRIQKEIDLLKSKADKSTVIRTTVVENIEKYLLLLRTFYTQVLFGGKNLFKKQSDIIILDKADKVKIVTPGIYVRYIPNTTKQGWLYRFEQLKKAINYLDLSSIPAKKYQKPKERYQVSKSDLKNNFHIYLSIEKKIPDYWDSKDTIIDSVYSVQHDVKKSGASIIDRIIEDLTYTDKKDDKELNSLVRHYKNTYYSVATRYQLPTLRDLPTFLKILNEIVS